MDEMEGNNASIRHSPYNVSSAIICILDPSHIGTLEGLCVRDRIIYELLSPVSDPVTCRRRRAIGLRVVCAGGSVRIPDLEEAALKDVSEVQVTLRADGDVDGIALALGVVNGEVLE